MVYNQCEYLWQKRGVFYFVRHVPNDVQKHYERPRIVICLKTNSKTAALKASRSIASKLDDFWLQMRLADMDVPASHLLVKGKPKDAFTSFASTLSDALATYFSLKGTDRTALFFTSAKRNVGYVLEHLGDRPIDTYSSADAASFRDWLIARDLNISSISRIFGTVRSVINLTIQTRIEKEEHTSLNIIRIGTSGSMQKDIAVNTLLISEYGIGIDGLLHFYDYKNNADEHMTFLHFMETAGSEINFPIRPYIASASKKLIDTLGQNFLKGITLTCPGFYAPQGRVLRNDIAVPNLIENLRKFNHNNLQCTNFEMETAGIYGLSNVFGHQAISFNAILANRITNEFSTNPKIIIEKLIKTVLNRVSKL